MRANNRLLFLLAFLLAAGFTAGVIELFLLRFEAGDVYPPYSSLRADPLGTRALYESLRSLPGLTLTRNYQPYDRFKDTRVTLVFTGIDPAAFRGIPARVLEQYEEITRSGGRLVIAFLPLRKEPAGRPLIPDTRDLERRWGVRFLYLEPAKTALSGDESDQLPRQTVLRFGLKDQSWQPLDPAGGAPAVIERPLGKGSLVFVASSYLFSNQALLENRRSELITRVLGPAGEIVFDEYHFGVSESGSVVALARKYGLAGAAAALLLLAVLFLWKSSTSFLPPLEPERAPGTAIAGRDTASGFVNLLRRSVPPSGLLPVCLAEWEKSAHLRRGQGSRKVERMRAVMAGMRDPVTAYREMARIVAESFERKTA